MLVEPEFLFRVERDPAGVPPGTRVSHQRPRAGVAPVVLPVEQHPGRRAAGRWRRAASCSEPAVLEQQVRRMLADARSRSAGRPTSPAQWLYLRNLRRDHAGHAAVPRLRRQPAAGVPARDGAVLREHHARGPQRARPADAPTTRSSTSGWRKHYGIPNVYGSRFRRVTLDDDSQRGGLLRQGSILTVTSYATRTSPVMRGKWMLENLLGTPPPPPPPNVPALDGQHRRGQRCRCASGWRSIAPTRRARAATS